MTLDVFFRNGSPWFTKIVLLCQPISKKSTCCWLKKFLQNIIFFFIISLPNFTIFTIQCTQKFIQKYKKLYKPIPKSHQLIFPHTFYYHKYNCCFIRQYNQVISIKESIIFVLKHKQLSICLETNYLTFC